jgi:hypothetical protein
MSKALPINRATNKVATYTSDPNWVRTNPGMIKNNAPKTARITALIVNIKR